MINGENECSGGCEDAPKKKEERNASWKTPSGSHEL